MSRLRSRITSVAIVGLLCYALTLATTTFWNQSLHAAETSGTAAKTNPDDKARSVNAFRQVASVLRHPRCMNCHTVTNFPRQGDDRHPHVMGVLRGADDHGHTAMRCNSCHASKNQENGVPGAPNWGLAPLSMGWENMDDYQLAETIKDRSRNGNKSLEELFEHMAHDELVAWGWNPGAKRTPIPMPRADFARAVREWIDTGAHTPEATKLSSTP